MKLIVRHADGIKSEWQMDEKDPVLAIGIVSRFITAATGAPPRTVLALIEDGKRDGTRNGKGAAPRKGRNNKAQSDERNRILGANCDKEKGNNKGEGSETQEPLGPASDD